MSSTRRRWHVDHRDGRDVPAWFLDTDYNEMCFLVSQAFFPRTSAWENLKRALHGEFEDTVWEHLAGRPARPFPPASGARSLSRSSTTEAMSCSSSRVWTKRMTDD